MTPSVLMFCPQFRPLVGGAERQAEKLSKALVQRGLCVTVLTPHLVGDSPEYEEDSGVVIHRFPLFDLCKRFPMVPGLGPVNLVALSIQTRRAVIKFVDTHDIVHAHGVSALTAFGLSATRKANKPFICKLASSGAGFDLRKLSDIGIGGQFLANYLRDHVTAWVATCNAVTESLKEYGVPQKRIVQIPNGVELPKQDASRNPPRNCSNVRRLLYVGRLSRSCDRDFETLFDAFSHLAAKYEDLELALVGEGDLFDSLKTSASHSAFALRVHMPGLVKDPTEWFEWADCFVLPSRREGMSNSLIEAMAFGLVCIANDIAANREVLEDGKAGYLTAVGDVGKLIANLERLITLGDGSIQIGKKAAARAQQEYAIETVALKYQTAYEHVACKA